MGGQEIVNGRTEEHHKKSDLESFLIITDTDIQDPPLFSTL